MTFTLSQIDEIAKFRPEVPGEIPASIRAQAEAASYITQKNAIVEQLIGNSLRFKEADIVNGCGLFREIHAALIEQPKEAVQLAAAPKPARTR